MMIQQNPNPEPTVGNWYDSKDFYECFKVVDVDEKSSSVEIQYFDGDIEEIDYEVWLASHPHEISEPEDASAPYELEHEDMLNLLNEIENQEDLEDHLRHIDLDDLE